MITMYVIHAQTKESVGGNVEGITILKLTIIYELNMLTSDKLIMLLLRKNDCIWHTKHKDVIRGAHHGHYWVHNNL
jgi:hypothetical protein